MPNAESKPVLIHKNLLQNWSLSLSCDGKSLCAFLCVLRKMHVLISVLCISFFTLNSFSGSAQSFIERKVFLNDSISGNARVAYIVESGDTLPHGAFAFYSCSEDTLNPGVYALVEYAGAYKRGKKNGEWIYRSARLERNGKSVIKGYDIVQPGLGEEFRIKGNFLNGVAEGKWQSVRQTVREGEVRDTVKFINATYANGKPVGEVWGVDRGVTFSGSFTDMGRLNGDWKFVYNTEAGRFEETRAYDNGVFSDHFLQFEGSKIHLAHPGLDFSEANDDVLWSELPLSSSVFEVFNETILVVKGAKQKDQDYILGVRKSNDVMTRALFSFGRRSELDVWALVGGSEPLLPPLIRLRMFPFSDSERQALEQGIQEYAKVSGDLKAFLSDPSVDIGRFAYEDAAMGYEVILVYKEAVEKIGKILVQLQNPAYLYIDRPKLLEVISPEISYPEYVQYEFNDTLRTRSWAFPTLPQHSLNSIEELTNQLNEISKGFTSALENVETTLEEYKRQTFLAEIESKIIAERDQVVNLFSGEERPEDHNVLHAKIASAVIDLVRDVFKNYARLSPEDKVTEAERTLVCYKNIVTLYDEVVKQPLREGNLKDQYTRTIWNAYVFTYMDETVKERLFKAYENQLLPAITEDLRTNLTCSNIESKAGNYAALYRRMLELRETDTKAQERQIRRSPSIETIIEVFGFNLNLGGA